MPADVLERILSSLKKEKWQFEPWQHEYVPIDASFRKLPWAIDGILSINWRGSEHRFDNAKCANLRGPSPTLLGPRSRQSLSYVVLPVPDSGSNLTLHTHSDT